MDSRTQLLFETAAHQEPLLGELRGLLDQLGSAESLINLAAAADALAQPDISSWNVFRKFISTYKTKVLYGHELGAIYRAYAHARANESRELVALDQELSGVQSLQPFAGASQRIGEAHLQALARLRGERVPGKYLVAVREQRAHGWHTLVYGLMLAVYSIPVRQGLVSYARHILQSYIRTAGHAFAAPAEERELLLETLSADLAPEVERVLRTS